MVVFDGTRRPWWNSTHRHRPLTAHNAVPRVLVLTVLTVLTGKTESFGTTDNTSRRSAHCH
ncbi:hypothetical protein E2C01_001899 [Portunus trituberculatus]|uniref:Uncharacterized protein n=1 Tax=Portunus trituberculatus TaxID=210409 RepID=A0A5B7CHZ3_PORTR|nr:hypothetical protein [Portunus trituberculatus]